MCGIAITVSHSPETKKSKELVYVVCEDFLNKTNNAYLPACRFVEYSVAFAGAP